MRYSVTGTASELTEDQIHFVGSIITDLAFCDELNTGGAHGVDTWAFTAGLTVGYPVVRIIAPDAPWNQSLYQYLTRPNVKIEYAPLASTKGKAYMLRNDALVAAADVLLAFPKTAREELRSGTWATIRRARKAGIPVRMFPLDAVPA